MKIIKKNSFDEFQIHELENYNLVGGGQRWYGDLFDVDLERQIALDFEGISSLTVDFKYALASNATSISGNKLDILINDKFMITYTVCCFNNKIIYPF